MKTAFLLRRGRAWCAAITLGALAFLPALHAENAPRIDALRVAKIAADYLAGHGKDAPYVISIVLAPDAFIGGETSWIVRWSSPLASDGNKEVGMRVKLNGSVSYLVEEKPGRKKRAVPLK